MASLSLFGQQRISKNRRTQSLLLARGVVTIGNGWQGDEWESLFDGYPEREEPGGRIPEAIHRCVCRNELRKPLRNTPKILPGMC